MKDEKSSILFFFTHHASSVQVPSRSTAPTPTPAASTTNDKKLLLHISKLEQKTDWLTKKLVTTTSQLRDSEHYLVETEEYYQKQKRTQEKQYNDLLDEHARTNWNHKDAVAKLTKQLRDANETNQKNSDVLEGFICIVCVTKNRNAVPPCGHTCMCMECASNIKPKICPICRVSYRTNSLRTLYLS